MSKHSEKLIKAKQVLENGSSCNNCKVAYTALILYFFLIKEKEV